MMVHRDSEAMTTPGQTDEGGSRRWQCVDLCPEEQHQPRSDLVLRVVLGCDPSSSTSSSVLPPFHAVSNQGRAVALRTIRHLHLERAAEQRVPPERQLAVLAAADHATTLTLHTSQVEGLVACLVQQLEQQPQQQQELEQQQQLLERVLEEQADAGVVDELVQEGMLQLSLGCQAAPPTTSSRRSSCGRGSSSKHSAPTSSSAADVAAAHPITLSAAKPHGPYFKQLTVTGPIHAATIQHLEQLLDLLPGTQTLEEVVLSEQQSGTMYAAYQNFCEYLRVVAKWPTEAGQAAGAGSQQSQPHIVRSNSSSKQSRSGVGPGGTAGGWRSTCSTLAVTTLLHDAGNPASTQLGVADLLPVLRAMQQPRMLFLGGVLTEQLPLYVEHLRPLQVLHIASSRSYGPGLLACVAQLTNLRHLGMCRCGTPLTTWPGAFSALVHLYSLHLTLRHLTLDALEGLCSMTRLRMISMSGATGFETLPTSISKLVRLEVLVLEKSPVGHLPECITGLTALRRLYWSELAATAPLPLEVVWRLKTLVVLSLTDDHLAALPDAISQLSALRALKVTGRALAALLNTLDALVELKALRLHAPGLRTLHEGITALTNLQRITAPSVLLRGQSPAVCGFLAGRQAQGCEMKLAPGDSA